jgi:hypothetical protein
MAMSKKARTTIAELDATSQPLAGRHRLYVVAGGRRYVMRDAARLAAAAKAHPSWTAAASKTRSNAKRSPAAGKRTARLQGKSVLLVSAVDRFGMAEALVKQARCGVRRLSVHSGLPFPMRRLATVRALGALILPVATKLPFKMLYPTGEKQDAHHEYS